MTQLTCFFLLLLAADMASRNFFGSLWSPVGPQRGWALPSIWSVPRVQGSSWHAGYPSSRAYIVLSSQPCTAPAQCVGEVLVGMLHHRDTETSGHLWLWLLH